MKFTLIALLILTLIVGVANLALAFGFIPTPGHEYKAYAAQQMDEVGFRKLAEKNSIPVGEDGKIKFPQDMRDKLFKHNLLPFTIQEIEAEGWKFVTVTPDNHYIFRK